jgi:hypothetical protein
MAEQFKAGDPRTERPEDPASALPPDAPQAMVDEARGVKPPSKRAERAQRKGAVAYLLGQQRAPRYKVKVEFATDDGDIPLWFYIHSIDSKRIDKIEKAHTDRDSLMGEMDDLAVNAELVADALICFSDDEPGTPEFEEAWEAKDGRVTEVNSPEFLAGNASSAEALMQRFHWQGGLLTGVAQQVRRISGWAPDRVGQAQRVLVDAAGNS